MNMKNPPDYGRGDFFVALFRVFHFADGFGSVGGIASRLIDILVEHTNKHTVTGLHRPEGLFEYGLDLLLVSAAATGTQDF